MDAHSHHFIQHRFGSSSQGSQKFLLYIGKEVKLPLFTVAMLVYIDKPKDTIRKLWEPINKFSKFIE